MAKMASDLMLERPKITGRKELLMWNKKVADLLKLKQSMISNENKPEDLSKDADYQYLQDVINKKLFDMRDDEISVNLTRILKARSGSDAYMSYIRQAINSYYESYKSMSDQIMWSKS